jgi:hypothetical protein
MNKYLFIDNFRGFTDTYVPLVDVNFLVGENSTGKTSLLGLVKLFASPKLFVGFGDPSDDSPFGHFNEMVSAHSDDRSYFRIGFVDEQSSHKKNHPSVSGMLLTYTERDGLPELSMFTCAANGRGMHVRFASDKTWFKIIDTESVSTTEAMTGVMPHWAAVHANRDDEGWTELELPVGFPVTGIPLFVLFSLVSQAVAAKDKKNSAMMPMFAPFFGAALVWIAPIRTKPRRTYDEPQNISFSSEGEHTPYLIKRILEAGGSEARDFRKFMAQAGSSSGLFQSVKINRFGKGSTAPFEVDAMIDGKPLSLSTVGYGVSQALPILVELSARPTGAWFAIQQPEVHLHPRAQASLGDAFFEMAVADDKRFLIETHSDFAIDRFRLNYRKSSNKKPNSQVLFFERRDKHNTVTSLPINSQGELPSDQPDSYRCFFIKEEINILGL